MAGAGPADCWVTAIPTAYLRDTLGRFAGVGGSAPVISLTKGIEAATFRRPSEIIAEVLGAGREVAVLSGPSHAEEVARGMPTSLAVAAADLNLAVWVQQRFGTDRCRLVAEGVIDAWRAGDMTEAGRWAAIDARFSAVGLSLDRPWLRAGQVEWT